jgi:hypothetical protein
VTNVRDPIAGICRDASGDRARHENIRAEDHRARGADNPEAGIPSFSSAKQLKMSILDTNPIALRVKRHLHDSDVVRIALIVTAVVPPSCGLSALPPADIVKPILSRGSPPAAGTEHGFLGLAQFRVDCSGNPILGSLVIRAGEKSKEAHDKDPWWWSIK